MYSPPVTSSGSRSPEKRPRPLPKHVRAMLVAMVRGREDDPDCVPLSFIEAAKLYGIAPDVARRWLDRPEARSFLRAERRAFRESICASNEHHLARIRGGPNAAAGVRAIQVLEQLDDVDTQRQTRGNVSPGLVVVITGGPSPRPAAPVSPIIEHEPRDDREPPDTA